MCSGRASCALRRERYQCRVAALTCATVRRRTAAPVSMCVFTPARSRTCPTEPMGTCAPSIRCVGSHERMLASSTEQVGTDMHTHMPSGAPLSRRTGAPSQRHTCAQRGVHAGSMRGLCLAIEAGAFSRRNQSSISSSINNWTFFLPCRARMTCIWENASSDRKNITARFPSRYACRRFCIAAGETVANATAGSSVAGEGGWWTRRGLCPPRRY